MELAGDDIVESLCKLPRLSEFERAVVKPENRISELSNEENNVLLKSVLNKGEIFVLYIVF